MSWALQETVLRSLGATAAEAAELLAYGENVFDLGALDAAAAGGEIAALPLGDEPSAAFWAPRVAEARRRGAVAVLGEHLPQLHFPIRQGMSASADYLAATRRGAPPESLAAATGLDLEHPEAIELELYPSPAGSILLIVVRGRAEFVALAQALAARNEPRPVAEAQGALAISGYVNWSRLRARRAAWEATPPAARRTATWEEEMAALKAAPESYQDRFILLSNGPYSAVPAAALGLEDEPWRDLSLAIRRDHECAHYFTKRLLGSMRNRLLDELIADYAGITAAAGRFRADWLRRFLGVEDFPRLRPGGRLEVYRGEPPLSAGAFRVLAAVAHAAAATLERFDAEVAPRSPRDRALALAAIASHRAEDLAAADGAPALVGTYRELARRFAP